MNHSGARIDLAVDRPFNKNAKNAWYVGAESLSSVPSSFQKSLSASSLLKTSPSILPANKSPSISSAFLNSSTAHDSSSSPSHSEPVVQSQPACLRIFISDNLKSCISVSENIGFFSSIFIALWVVFIDCGYLPGNDNVKSTPSLRLLYLALLSDAAIVFGLLLTGGGCNKKNEAGPEDQLKALTTGWSKWMELWSFVWWCGRLFWQQLWIVVPMLRFLSMGFLCFNNSCQCRVDE